MSRSFRRPTISFAETPRKFLNSTVRTTGGLTDTLRSSAWAFSSAPVPATTDKNHPTLILDLLPAGGRLIATLVFVENNELADAAHAASVARVGVWGNAAPRGLDPRYWQRGAARLFLSLIHI